MPVVEIKVVGDHRSLPPNSEFWRNSGVYTTSRPKPSRPNVPLAVPRVLRKRMLLTNSAAGCSGIGKARAPGRRQGRSRIIGELFYRLRTAYARTRRVPGSDCHLTWLQIQGARRRMNWQWNNTQGVGERG